MILGFVALVVVLGMIELSEAGESALRVIHRTSDTIRWVSLGTLILLWPLSAVVTHAIAGFRGFRARFLKVFHVTGKVWILHVLTLIVTDVVVIVLVSMRWTTLAQLWYIAFRGGLLWGTFYPAAIESIYGPNVRSCLMTFLTWLVVILWIVATAVIMRFLYVVD